MTKNIPLRTLSALFVVPALLLLAGSTTGCGNKSKGLSIKGSDTEVNMVSRMAEVYQNQNKNARISVTGGGSGTGIAALINGKVDIANASRAMKKDEKNQARNAGLDPTPVVIAMDGLSVIVHPENDVTKLTLKQLRKIYRGEITNWNDLGGPDQDISLYGRQSNSGTFVYFRDHVVEGDYTQEMNRMNGNGQIVEAVKSDKAAIGYVGVGYITEDGEVNQPVQIVKIARKKGDPYVSPLKNNAVKNGTYPIARPLYQWVDRNKYKNTPLMQNFISFELSEKGQEIVRKEGFFPVSKKYREQNRKNGFSEKNNK